MAPSGQGQQPRTTGFLQELLYLAVSRRPCCFSKQAALPTGRSPARQPEGSKEVARRHQQQPNNSKSVNSLPVDRAGMPKQKPGQASKPEGYLFLCTSKTQNEAMAGLFGLAGQQWSAIQDIKPGTHLFLLNIITKVSMGLCLLLLLAH